MQLRAVVHEAMPERARMGQTPTGKEGDCLRSAGQWLLVVRRAGAVAADLRFAGAGGYRSGVPEMAGADTFAVAAGRVCSWRRLAALPHADLRPAPAWPRVLRRNHSRQSGPGPAGPGTVGVRSGGDQETPGRVPHACDSGRRASEPAHQLQELRPETILQRRPRLPDGGNLPQSEELRREQGISQSALSTEDRP